MCTLPHVSKIFKQQNLHPKYTWIAYGWYAQASWVNGDIVNCTENQLKMVLESGISVEVFPIPENTNAATVTGLVRSFSTSFFNNRESLSTEINSARFRSSNYNMSYLHVPV